MRALDPKTRGPLDVCPNCGAGLTAPESARVITTDGDRLSPQLESYRTHLLPSGAPDDLDGWIRMEEVCGAWCVRCGLSLPVTY